MQALRFRVVNDATENVKVFGNIETSVEYCQARLHENFTVYIEGNSPDVEQFKRRLYRALTLPRNMKIR